MNGSSLGLILASLFMQGLSERKCVGHGGALVVLKAVTMFLFGKDFVLLAGFNGLAFFQQLIFFLVGACDLREEGRMNIYS